MRNEDENTEVGVGGGSPVGCQVRHAAPPFFNGTHQPSFFRLNIGQIGEWGV